MKLRRTRPTDAALARVHAAASSDALSYPERGCSLGPELPGGYFHDRRRVVIGHGPDDFAAARRALRAWCAHRGAHLALHPEEPALDVGTTVAISAPVLMLFVDATCRVVAVVDEHDAFGFAYGTLRGHPERGEESFVVRHHPDGAVTFEVTAFSRPGHPLTWLVLPYARHLQHRAVADFVRGVAEYVSNERSAVMRVGSRAPRA